MNLKGKKIGVSFTGSFCTFEKVFTELQKLKEEGAELYPIFSNSTQTVSSRFGNPEAYFAKVKDITSIEDEEKRVRAEQICLKLAKDCIINRDTFLCGDDYLKALLMALK